jgi:hypothetical protein
MIKTFIARKYQKFPQSNISCNPPHPIETKRFQKKSKIYRKIMLYNIKSDKIRKIGYQHTFSVKIRAMIIFNNRGKKSFLSKK